MLIGLIMYVAGIIVGILIGHWQWHQVEPTELPSRIGFNLDPTDYEDEESTCL